MLWLKSNEQKTGKGKVFLILHWSFSNSFASFLDVIFPFANEIMFTLDTTQLGRRTCLGVFKVWYVPQTIFEACF